MKTQSGLASTRIFLSRWMLCCALLSVCAAVCAAQENAPQEAPAKQSAFASMTTLRSTLAAHGVEPALLQRSEIFGALTHHELAQHDVTALASELFSVNVNAAKLVGLRGRAFLSMQMVHGTGLVEDPLGSYQLASNLDAASYVKLIEAWYADAYWHERLGFKAGRMYSDTDFGTNDSASDFLNAGYGVVPTAPMPTYPMPQMGFMGYVDPLPWAVFSAGVYRGDMLADKTGAREPIRKSPFTIAELKFKPAALRSVFRLGGWRQSDGAYRVNDSGENELVANHGAYATVDYWPLMRSEEEKGPALFARWGWAPANRNGVCGHLEGGLSYPGLFPKRKADAFGIGFTQVSLTNAKRETVLESYYKFQLNKYFALQPDVQYALHASGKEANRAVAGARLTMSF